MNIIAWVIIGLVAGILAKALMPGSSKEPKGCLMTMALGIGGSLLVGFIVNNFMGGGSGGLIPSIIGATIGAMILIFAARKVWA